MAARSALRRIHGNGSRNAMRSRGGMAAESPINSSASTDRCRIIGRLSFNVSLRRATTPLRSLGARTAIAAIAASARIADCLRSVDEFAASAAYIVASADSAPLSAKPKSAPAPIHRAGSAPQARAKRSAVDGRPSRG